MSDDDDEIIGDDDDDADEYEGHYGEEFGKYEHLDLEAEQVQEESVLTEYDPDDFVSGAVNSPYSTIPVDLFDFEYSYGYDCFKYFNLCACDDSVVCWAAGSIVTFMDIHTKQTWFRRSTTGGTVGNIASYRVDPDYRIAIAEAREGANEPVIVMYTWPQMEIDAVLREGTENAYSILDFSPDGEMLASVGKEPDYNITIWNWKRHKIMLRTSAFTYDVDAVMFSPYCPGQLTTGGHAHIKFWKLVQTFTGLKLKGELGRFGKTEICNVVGVYPMPDEKVLSGCEWGNILVWEAGLVKLEVTQRGRKRCHNGPIIQFMLSPAGDEVTTISRDGCIRAWYWDTVEQADPPEDDQFVELNPVAETCVPGCQIMCLKHQKDQFWYAQDGNGGIWTVELELDKLECDHRKMFTTHAGPVVAILALRTHPILLTMGKDGAIMAYNINTHALLARYMFSHAISCTLYVPLELDHTSRSIMVGFEDGMMRTLLFHADRLLEQKNVIDIRVHSALTIHSEDSIHADVMDLVSWLKPHSKKLVQMSFNTQYTLLVTCGEDSTIFMYKVMSGNPLKLERLGFIETPNIVAYMTWKPNEERVLLLCGQAGLVIEAVLPDAEVRKYTEITTFKLEFESRKDVVVKKQYMRHRPFPTEDDLASIDEEALKAAAEAADMDKDEEEEEWVGEVELIEDDTQPPTTITWAEYCDDGIWVIQKGTGALLLIKPGLPVKPGVSNILKYGPFPQAWLDDFITLRFVCDRKYLVAGTNNGYIRVVRMPYDYEDNPDHHFQKWMTAMQILLKKLKGRRLAKEETQPIPRIDFVDNYYLQMHDRYTGAITCMDFSADGKYFFTCGGDGNIFSYLINFEEPLYPPPELPHIPELPKVEKLKEPSTVEGQIMSHEQLKQKEEYEKMMAIANAHKKRVRDQLAELTSEYNKLIKANRVLPASQQIDVTLDPRPLEVQEQELEVARQLAVRKVAHQLEASDLGLWKMYSRNIIQLDVFPFTLRAIRDPKVMIRPLRQKNLSKAFFDQLEEVHQKMAEAALRGRRTESSVRRMAQKRPSWGPPRVASFLLGLPPRPPHPLKKALRNYYTRLHRHHIQFIEWQDHLSRKPDPNALPPGAAEALKEAEASIGNYLLKTAPDYIAPPGHNTQLRLCLTRQEIYENKREFNAQILELRERKLELVDRMNSIGERLGEIRLEIPPKLVKAPPEVPSIDEELEFPEKNLEVKPETVVVTLRGPSTPGTKRGSMTQEKRKSLLFPQPRLRQPKVPRFVSLAESRPLAASWDLLRPRPDHHPTPMEVEIRERRIERHLFEQDMLLVEADISVREFDSRLRQLQRERIRVQEKNQLLELHLYQMHQEMNVLNRFEAHEDKLAEKVYTKLMQVRAVQEQIQECETRIEEYIDEKENLDVECQEIQSQFKKLVHDNKFADFLRRIFKKKYRQPRTRDDDEGSSEESSSSSSSEEEDEGSLDSRDIGPIRLDPNVCPEGCDQDLYDKTYELRNTRHKYEQQMQEQDRLVELLKKDIDAHNKIKRKLSVQLDKRKNNLREFMMEKQSCLNEIDQVVILHYDQIRAAALLGCTGPDGLKHAVVFPEQLLLKLRKRVLELQEEIRLQRIRAKINRTHLFRMNIDLREMQRLAEEIRAQMRDVLTRKLGKPRKVDKTLDDVLRQMARRHKYTDNLRILPHMLQQFRTWRERHSELEKKYLNHLDRYSSRLRLAAALQADVLPQKPCKDPSIMYGAYNLQHYSRDVVRLRIVRSQQLQQIKQLQEEIGNLRLKPSDKTKITTKPPPLEPEPSEIYLYMIPHMPFRTRHKYFPITPLSSQSKMIHEVNVMKLLYDCLDAMRHTREDADLLLKDLTDAMPEVFCGARSRFEVVDELVRKWLLKHGGDPSQYKKQTRAFDALAMIADTLIRQHLESLEGATDDDNLAMDQLEAGLRGVSDMDQSLGVRMAPVLAALFHTAETDELATEETMTSLVNSLIDDDHKLTEEEIDNINVPAMVEDIKDLSVRVPDAEIERIILLAIECLRAQLLSLNETEEIELETEKAIVSASQAAFLIAEPPNRTSISRDMSMDRTHRSSREGDTSRSRLSTVRSRQSSLVKPRVSLAGSKIIVDPTGHTVSEPIAGGPSKIATGRSSKTDTSEHAAGRGSKTGSSIKIVAGETVTEPDSHEPSKTESSSKVSSKTTSDSTGAGGDSEASDTPVETPVDTPVDTPREGEGPADEP
ncbi:cilia- and flagella-associated protein 44 [Pectinophora gossypiella]|uniref:cilia- and flagella-associated protein 44 n=1 Tax=Pectinophora gossypiella TaxID=13191 RepID=UPI00214ECB02|nr:cilia- and flagella-associated protein 44 [Pectinophora gossypiella]